MDKFSLIHLGEADYNTGLCSTMTSAPTHLLQKEAFIKSCLSTKLKIELRKRAEQTFSMTQMKQSDTPWLTMAHVTIF